MNNKDRRIPQPKKESTQPPRKPRKRSDGVKEEYGTWDSEPLLEVSSTHPPPPPKKKE